MKTVVISKSFTTHKRGESDKDIQDSVSINELKGRYALSDGISRSFLPRLLADIITENFTANGTLSSVSLSQLFNLKKEEYLSTLDDEGVALQEIAEETFKNASATFVGLEICNQKVTWKVLGDSCLLIIPQNGTPQCICSNKVTINDDSKIHVIFGNNTAHIRSDGKIYGSLIEGEADMIESGWYVLMSDAISEWFINMLNDGCNMAPFLFKLERNDEFEEFIESEYKSKRMRSDDCSVILIRIDENIIKDNNRDDKPDDDYFFSNTHQNKESKEKKLEDTLNPTDQDESEGQSVAMNHKHQRKCLSRLLHRIFVFFSQLGKPFHKQRKKELNKGQK